jgi:hypothetical protein
MFVRIYTPPHTHILAYTIDAVKRINASIKKYELREHAGGRSGGTPSPALDISKELKLFRPIRCSITQPWRSADSGRLRIHPSLRAEIHGANICHKDTDTMRRHYAGKEFGRSKH